MPPLDTLPRAIRDSKKAGEHRKPAGHLERFQGGKLMFNVGAFAGGLAQGIRSGQEMQIKARAADRLAQEADREDQMHEFRMDKAIFEKNKRARLKAANEEIAAGWSNEGQATTGKPGVPVGGGLKEVSPVNRPEAATTRAASPATRSQADGLMSQYG